MMEKKVTKTETWTETETQTWTETEKRTQTWTWTQRQKWNFLPEMWGRWNCWHTFKRTDIANYQQHKIVNF